MMLPETKLIINRLLSKIALIEKIDDFRADLIANFESICEQMIDIF